MLEAASAQMEIQLKDLVDQRLTIREQEKKLEEKYKEGSNHTKPIYLRAYDSYGMNHFWLEGAPVKYINLGR